MNVKKLSIATICGLVATMVASIVPIMLYYQPHSEALAKKYPNVVNATPDMVPALIGMIIYLFITALIFDRMGVKSIKEGAITVTPDPDGVDFPTVDYDWSQSRTDVMHYNIGLHFTSK